MRMTEDIEGKKIGKIVDRENAEGRAPRMKERTR